MCCIPQGVPLDSLRGTNYGHIHSPLDRRHQVRNVLVEETEVHQNLEKHYSLNMMRFIEPPLLENDKSRFDDDYSKKEQLLVGVIIPHSRLTRMETIFDTWARSVSRVIFFTNAYIDLVGEGLEGLPVVRLYNTVQWNRTTAVLKYMHDHYSQQYNWFMIVSEATYVRGHKLEDFLTRRSSNEMVYMGKSVVGEASSELRYCNGGPGVIFSQAALQAVIPYLTVCMESGNQSNNVFAELGICVMKISGMKCSSEEVNM